MYVRSVFQSVVRICSVRYYKKDSTKRLLEFLADMPKVNTARISDAQRQRLHIAKKGEKYGPSTVYLQVLGSGARGVPNTLYLFTDQKRYLFNCGECTQRLAHEHKVKLSRLEHIFITSKTWRNIGGLPGLSLTLQDVGVPSIMLHGPEGLDELYNATKRFVIMKDTTVSMAKCSPSEDFEDGVMNVKYVLLGPHDDILVKDVKDLKPAAKKPKLSDTQTKEFEEFIRDDTDYYKHDVRHFETNTNTNNIPKTKYVRDKYKDKSRSPDKSAQDSMKKKTEKVLHDLQKKSNCSVAYICTLKKRLGTLDLAKCVELGVKPGPMLGQLKSGQDVVLPDGTLVLSKDVKTPDDPGPVFIVLEVPDISYLKDSEFSSHFDDGVNPPENIPTLIVHYTPPHVFHEPAYRSFMRLFGPSTRHLILNEQNSCLGSEAVHKTQHKLHLLDPDIFPLLRDVSVPAVWNAHPPLPKTNSPIRIKGLEELKNKIAVAQFQNIIHMEGSCKGDCRPATQGGEEEERLELMAARTLTMFHLRPKKQLDRSSEPKLHIQDYIQETMDVDGFVSSLEQFRRLVDSMRYAKIGSQKEYPKVVFLGTGSCIPSKTRNTSSIVIHISEDQSMLLDCGEGTFGQLVRFYGPKRVNAFLRTLNAIYVSHLHADHHIGLIGVLQARQQAFEELHPEELPEPLFLLAPGQIVSWLSMYDQQFERIRSEYTLVPNQNLLIDGAKGTEEISPAILAKIGINYAKTCLVSHCPNAFGITIEIDKHKITYSGDTIPCEHLVKLGMDSSLLIHEATMEDELADEARVKMHSTTTQAIGIGRQMNARYTVLTHFSQRYARLPRLNPNILNDNNSVGIAFDNMQITMSDLELLPHMYAPLQLMFAEHCVEMELKAANRARQKTRAASPLSLMETGADTSQMRRLSPGCKGSSHVPQRAPCRYYRESNASRLRQEMKGMTLSGGMGTPRSLSSSPHKKTARSRVSRSPDSSSVSSEPPLLNEIPPDQVDIIAAPRTMSETSNFSRDGGDRKSPCDVSSACIVDTRSRTLSAVKKPTDEEIEIQAKGSNIHTLLKAPNNNMQQQHAAEPVGNGYGKPLLTPINKRLMLRREVSKQASVPMSTPMSDKMAPIVRVKSPMKRKAENRKCTVPTSNNKLNLTGTKLPVKCSSSSKGGTNTSACVKPLVETGPQSKLPVLRDIRRETLIRAKSANPSLRSYKQRSPKSASPDLNTTSHSPAKSLYSKSRLVKSPSEISKSVPKDLNKLPSRESSLTDYKKLPSLREALAEHVKKQQQLINKDIKPISIIGRPTSANHSTRSFKPQLEDIKSSFLLLNKKHNNVPKDNDPRLPPVCKPKPLNEIERCEQLNEIKKKFQSRGFFHDSKYDKIEGLNWISWK